MPTGPRAGRNLQRRGVVRELGMKKSLPPPSLLMYTLCAVLEHRTEWCDPLGWLLLELKRSLV